MVTITLSDEQAMRLRMVIMLTTRYRTNEAEACERLSKETNEDGTAKYPAMASNAAWWKETNIIVEEILEIIKDA
jgi:hypothetical protein